MPGSVMLRGRIQRYKSQSIRCRASALRVIREGDWRRAEDLLWGSLAGAVKAVALSRGVELSNDEDMKSYVVSLAGKARDRKLGQAFNQLSSFSDASFRAQDSRVSPERLYHMAECVGYSVDRLWEMLPPDEESEHGQPR